MPTEQSHRELTLPNLVVAGVTKAGTTSLFHYLGQHPDVCPSDVKEVRYFNPLRYGLEVEPLGRYAEHFRHHAGERYILEATPSYFYGGHAIAAAIDEVSPSARIIISLREPVARCWSWFQFIKSRTGIPKTMSFTAYLDECERLRVAGQDGTFGSQAYWGLSGGCYSDWLGDWAETLGDRVRVIFFDDVVGDPRGSVREICAWLGIDQVVVDGFVFDVDNKTTQYRHGRLQKVAVRANRRAEKILGSRPGLKAALRRSYYAVNKAPTGDTMSTADRERLTRFYEPFNERLSQQLAARGLRLPDAWSSAAGRRATGP